MRIHPQCERDCRHPAPVPNGFLVQRRGAREEYEPEILRKAGGRRVAYLGMLGPHSGEEAWPACTWRVGGTAWKPAPRTPGVDEGKPSRTTTIEYRREVWTGSGQPVGPVDFSRPAEPEPENFPAPLLTSEQDTEQAEPSAPARDLLAHAEQLGWTGTITRAEGWVPHATHGRPSSKPKVSEAVRLSRGLQRAVAVRMGGSWNSLWTWSATQFFRRHATLALFRQELI